MDELERVIARYAGTKFCELASYKQSEYLGALAQRGAADALKAIGLNDADAAADIRDIRDLLKGLRVLKKAAWTTTLTAIGRVIGWAILIGLTIYHVVVLQHAFDPDPYGQGLGCLLAGGGAAAWGQGMQRKNESGKDDEPGQ